jgi:hypothetical protein
MRRSAKRDAARGGRSVRELHRQGYHADLNLKYSALLGQRDRLISSTLTKRIVRVAADWRRIISIVSCDRRATIPRGATSSARRDEFLDFYYQADGAQV